MCEQFKKIARDGLIDMSIMAALIACVFFCPPTVQEAFVGAAIAAVFMFACNASWRFGMTRQLA